MDAKEKVAVAVVVAVEVALEDQDLARSKHEPRVVRESGVVNIRSNAVATALLEEVSPSHSCVWYFTVPASVLFGLDWPMIVAVVMLKTEQAVHSGDGE
jgi:hypothetical protein